MRLIDADKVEGIFKGACKTGYFDNKPKEKIGASAFMDCIRELDTIDPESLRPKAKWEERQSWTSVLYCSNCGHEENWSTKYCPNCGAKMDLGEGEA